MADLLESLPPGAALVVTADHGQVDVGDDVITPAADVLRHVRLQSGEGRFRWLHARSGASRGPAWTRPQAHHGDTRLGASASSRSIAEGWFGPSVTDGGAGRLGDVALVGPGAPWPSTTPTTPARIELVGRHGSLTSAEMLVPLLATRA